MATRPTSRPVGQLFGENPANYAPFGLKGHEGEDYLCPTGDLCSAAGPGVVVVAQAGYGGYGNCIIIKHPDGSGTIYGHLLTRLVGFGQAVAEGQPIGYTDNTGNSSGPHLHFGYQPVCLRNLDNGYWGCVDPEVLFSQAMASLTEDQIKQFKEYLAGVAYVHGELHVPTQAERQARFGSSDADAVYNDIVFSAEGTDHMTEMFVLFYESMLGRSRDKIDIPNEIAPRVKSVQNRERTVRDHVLEIMSSQERKDYLAGAGRPPETNADTAKLAEAKKQADTILEDANKIKQL